MFPLISFNANQHMVLGSKPLFVLCLVPHINGFRNNTLCVFLTFRGDIQHQGSSNLSQDAKLFIKYITIK